MFILTDAYFGDQKKDKKQRINLETHKNCIIFVESQAVKIRNHHESPLISGILLLCP
jgi:hypothetical protein